MSTSSPATASDARPTRTAVRRDRAGAEPRTPFGGHSLGLWAVSVYAALFLIRPWEVMFPWVGYLNPERAMAAGLLLAVVFSARTRFRFGAHQWTLLAFIGVLLLSASGGIDFDRSWDAIYKLLTVSVLYLAMVWVIRTRRDLSFFLLSYLGANGLAFGKSMYDYFVHGAAEYRMGVKRMVGVNTMFWHPNAVSANIVLSLPFWLFLWIHRKRIAENWTPLWRSALNVFLISYVVFGAAAVVLCNSRSGMAAFVAFIGLAAITRPGLWKKSLAVGIGLVVLATVWIAMPEDSQNRLRTLWDPSAGPANAQESAEGRRAGFEAGLAIYRDTPTMGVGPANFTLYRGRFIDGEYMQAHNLVGQILGEIGWLGTTTFVALLLVTAWIAIRARHTRRLIPDGQMAAHLAGAVLMTLTLLLFLGIGSHNLYRYNWIWIGALACVAMYLARSAKDHAKNNANSDEKT